MELSPSMHYGYTGYAWWHIWTQVHLEGPPFAGRARSTGVYRTVYCGAYLCLDFIKNTGRPKYLSFPGPRSLGTTTCLSAESPG